ncbi:hypothetical protein [Amycolatopsis sp. ATCC 39116]|uniref:hypothetical protein n=1 Tax=Amycolatopsis sp. (strain ATCC 39116 / 75iv2) TaxID=385957 RepID=UPI0012FBE3A8|nr:hypothetical protein [Amycolatopsis sp. ATCC 39116]
MALYALRCSFAHDYSLVNIPRNKKNIDLIHHFFLDDDDSTDDLVRIPSDRWSGDLSRRSVHTATWVNLRRFGDLVERVYSQLCFLHTKGRLLIALSGGAAELRARYAFTVRPGMKLIDPQGG